MFDPTIHPWVAGIAIYLGIAGLVYSDMTSRPSKWTWRGEIVVLTACILWPWMVVAFLIWTLQLLKDRLMKVKERLCGR